MLCSRFLKKQENTPAAGAINFGAYSKLLKRLLVRKKAVALLAALLVAATAVIVPFMGSEFMPHADQAEILIELTLPEGSALIRTEGVVRNIESIIDQSFGDRVQHTYSTVGPTGSGTGEESISEDENTARLHLKLHPQYAGSAARIIQALDRELSIIPELNAQISLQQTALQSTLGTTTAPLIVEIKGDDLNILSALTDDIELPKGRTTDEMTHGIPVTYVPARNTIFLSFALVLGALA